MTSPVLESALPGATRSETGRPWRRAVIWLLLLAPFFFASYSFANWLASQRAEVGSIVYGWEHAIPFLAWTIVPYWSIDLVYGLSLLLPRTRAELDAHAKRLLTAQLISVACFIAFPLRFTFERPETGGFFGWLFDVLLGFDKPFNQAPSLHVSLLVILWSISVRYVGSGWRWLLHTWALLVGLSVLTTYQHHFIDIPTGLLVGCACVLLYPLDACPVVRQRDSRRWRLGSFYLVGGLALAALAVALGGVGLWLLWPASSLLAVAVIYFWGDPLRFGKGESAMDAAAWVLFAPYILAAWVNSRWWTRHRPQPSEVLPGLWLSRAPSRAELDRLKPAALVDCCAELPIGPAGIPVYAVPMLDLLIPEWAQIDQGVAAISQARQVGCTLVFCALGYSRSAIIVVAWLVRQGHASDIDEAIALVRRARPEVVLPPAYRAQLESWYEHATR
ncbi:MAG TPA: phosphatase PAP2/dual specificity phosphatase family protein [Burkholderiales bacterium]|jgi:protein-tyrosine phosphatase|nr:phosphatase PAP2/dual specificity phosphatase family protein [Burkholderiales bacterium]